MSKDYAVPQHSSLDLRRSILVRNDAFSVKLRNMGEDMESVQGAMLLKRKQKALTARILKRPDDGQPLAESEPRTFQATKAVGN